VPPDLLRQVPPAEFFGPTVYHALERFSMWDEILKEPAPPADLRYTKGMWHYARALAFAHRNRLAEAASERDSLADIAAATPMAILFDNLVSSWSLLHVALAVVDATIANARGDTDASARLFAQAIRYEDALRYDEPPQWPHPARQSAGFMLLQNGRPAEAETLFREDLRRNPENGWSLGGLAEALRQQHKTAAAAEADRRFRKAWSHADTSVMPAGS
jgi:tetratricopeptide (TPR) repeat protein